jgi:Ca2+-binding EF-hand superfamily protein
MDAIEWYHRVCRKHQMDIVIRRFKTIDKDHSGDIDISELKAMLPGVKGAKAAAALFATYDTNGDGKLSFEEFVPMLAALEGRAPLVHSEKSMREAAHRASTYVQRRLSDSQRRLSDAVFLEKES